MGFGVFDEGFLVIGASDVDGCCVVG